MRLLIARIGERFATQLLSGAKAEPRRLRLRTSAMIFAARGGTAPVVEGIASSEWPTPARRPMNSVLDCSAIKRDFGIAQPDWRAGVAEVIEALA